MSRLRCQNRSWADPSLWVRLGVPLSYIVLYEKDFGGGYGWDFASVDLYVVAIVVFVLVTDSPDITVDLKGEPVPGPFLAPIALPVYFITFFGHYDYFGSKVIIDNPWFRVTFVALFDFVLFSLLTYAVLRKLGWFESRKGLTEEVAAPPRV